MVDMWITSISVSKSRGVQWLSISAKKKSCIILMIMPAFVIVMSSHTYGRPSGEGLLTYHLAKTNQQPFFMFNPLLSAPGLLIRIILLIRAKVAPIDNPGGFWAPCIDWQADNIRKSPSVWHVRQQTCQTPPDFHIWCGDIMTVKMP